MFHFYVVHASQFIILEVEHVFFSIFKFRRNEIYTKIGANGHGHLLKGTIACVAFCSHGGTSIEITYETRQVPACQFACNNKLCGFICICSSGVPISSIPHQVFPAVHEGVDAVFTTIIAYIRHFLCTNGCVVEIEHIPFGLIQNRSHCRTLRFDFIERDRSIFLKRKVGACLICIVSIPALIDLLEGVAFSYHYFYVNVISGDALQMPARTLGTYLELGCL